jgi:hypothetical protein
MDARPALLGLTTCLRAERPRVRAGHGAPLVAVPAEGAGPAYNAHARTDLRDMLEAVADGLDRAFPACL